MSVVFFNVQNLNFRVAPESERTRFVLLIKVVPYVLGMTPGVPGAPEPRMYRVLSSNNYEQYNNVQKTKKT